jgi:hypothetical protein
VSATNHSPVIWCSVPDVLGVIFYFFCTPNFVFCPRVRRACVCVRQHRSSSLDRRTHGEAVQLINASQRTVELEVQHLGGVQWESIQQRVKEASRHRGDGSSASSTPADLSQFDVRMRKRGREPLGMALSSKAHKVCVNVCN